MPKKILNIISWVVGTGVLLAGMIFGIAKYISSTEIREARLKVRWDSLLTEERMVEQRLKLVERDYDSLYIFVEGLQGKVTGTIRAYQLLNKSYTKHIEKSEADKEELIQYMKEQVEQLKKSDQ